MQEPTQVESKVGITQASPSQFELEDLPQLNEVSQGFMLDQLGSESLKQSSAMPGLSIAASSMVIQNGENSTSNNQCQTSPESSINRNMQAYPDSSQQQVHDEQTSVTQTKVRPGLNMILPKDIVNDLLQEQGRRKVEKWVKRPHGNFESKIFETDVSPTRDYMLRKFNSVRR